MQTKSVLNGKTINLTGDNTIIKSTNFNVDKNGNMTCKNANVTGTITSSNATITGGVVTLNSSNYTAMKINSSKGKLNFDNNAIHAEDSRGNGNIAIQYTDQPMIIVTNNTGSYVGTTTIVGNHIITGSVNQTSLAEHKKNFEKMQDNALEIIKNIDIYKYNLKNEKDTDKKHIGFVIGDNYNYSKEVTSIDNKGVDNYSFTSLCCKAIQEQQEEIEELKKEIEKLKGGK